MSETFSYLLMAWSEPNLLLLTALGTFAGIYIGAIPGLSVTMRCPSWCPSPSPGSSTALWR